MFRLQIPRPPLSAKHSSYQVVIGLLADKTQTLESPKAVRGSKNSFFEGGRAIQTGFVRFLLDNIFQFLNVENQLFLELAAHLKKNN